MKLLVIYCLASIHDFVFFFRSDFLSKAPSNLTVNDLDDFYSLANHYATNTPHSFRKVKSKDFISFNIYLIAFLQGILFMFIQ